MAFISCKPKLVKGKARIFYRENGSKYVDVPYSHIFASKPLGEEEAGEIKESLEKNSYLMRHNIRVEIKPYGKTFRKVIQVYGPREIKKFLPEIFRTISSVDYLTWQYPVFSEFNPDTLEVGSPTDLETILREEVVAEDTEACTEGRRDGNFTELTTFATVWQRGHDVKSIIKKDVADSEKLLRVKAEEIRQVDPLVISTHNANYDLLVIKKQHRGKGGKIYTVGVDGSEPVQKASAGFLNIPCVAGRQVFCSLAFARNWLWSARNRLQDIVRFYGRVYDKRLEGEEDIDTTTEKAKAGEPGARESLEQYCLEDCMHHFFLYNEMARPAQELARAFETDLTSICFVSKSRLAMKLRDKRYFQELNTFRKSRQADLQEFDIYKAKAGFLGRGEPVFRTERGFYGNNQIIYAAYLNMFPLALRESIAHDPSISRLYDAVEKAGNTRDKIILSQGLEAFAEELVFDLYSNMPNFVFDKTYKISRIDAENHIRNFVKNFKDFLVTNNLKLINYSDRFVVIKSDNTEDVSDVLNRCGFVTPLGICSWVISGPSGRTVMKVGDTVSEACSPPTKVGCTNIIGTEWDFFGNRGLKTNFERNTLSEIVARVDRRDLDEALNFCARQYQALKGGKVSKEMLVYKKKLREEPTNYTDIAQETQWYRDAVSLGAKKDEEVRYGYAEGYKNPLREEEFLKPDIKPDIPKYMQNIFGKLYHGYVDEYYKTGRNKGKKKPRKNGTVGDMILALENIPMRKRKFDSITNFLDGGGTDKTLTLDSFA